MQKIHYNMLKEKKMKQTIRTFITLLIFITIICCFVGCQTIFNNCNHDWVPATCTKPKTCKICKVTEGVANNHKWIEATCTTPKTCFICTITEGSKLEHNYDDDNLCVRCGFKYVEQFTYKINEDRSGYILMTIGNFSGTDLIVPNKHKELPVVGIFEKAFFNCTQLTSVTLPATIIAIGPSVFEGCTNLKSFTFKDNCRLLSIGSRAFANCSNLKEINLPDIVQDIAEGAFTGCSSLQKITVPFVGTSVNASYKVDEFGYGYNNQNIDFGKIFGTQSYPNSYYARQYYIPSSLIEVTVTGGKIFNNSFAECRSIAKLTIGKNVTEFFHSSLRDCNKLTEIYNLSELNLNIKSFDDINTNIKYIYTDKTQASRLKIENDFLIFADDVYKEYAILAYLGTESTLILPDDVNGHPYSIFDYAFETNTSLNSVVFGKFIKAIGYSAFTNLKNIYIKDLDAWYNVELDSYFMMQSETCAYYLNNTPIENLVLPTDLLEINANLFLKCNTLKSVTIPCNSQLIAINDSAFRDCENLTTFIIEDENYKLNSIEAYAFSNCISLYDFPFEKCHALNQIGNYAFASCYKLDNVLFSNQCNLQKLGANAFLYCENLKFNTYQSAEYLGSTNNPYLVLYKISDYTITNVLTHENTKVISIEGNTSLSSFKETNIISIYIPKGVTYIYGRFNSNSFSNLNSLYIDDLSAWCNIEFEDINSNPLGHVNNFFVNAQHTTSLEIPNDVTIIKDYVFYNLPDSITKIFIPSSIVKIGDNAFGKDSYYNYFDEATKNIYIEDLIAWCAIEFETKYSNPLSGNNNIFILNLNTNDFEQITDLVIPSEIKEIKPFAFVGNTTLTSLDFEDNSQMKTIGNNAFDGCTELTHVKLPNELTHIHAYAFFNCDIREIIIPQNVEYIGVYAFDCENLRSVAFERTDNWYKINQNMQSIKIDLENPTNNSAILNNSNGEYFLRRQEEN